MRVRFSPWRLISYTFFSEKIPTFPIRSTKRITFLNVIIDLWYIHKYAKFPYTYPTHLKPSTNISEVISLGNYFGYISFLPQSI